MLEIFQIFSIVSLVLITPSTYLFMRGNRTVGYALVFGLSTISYVFFALNIGMSYPWYTYFYPLVHLVIVTSTVIFALNSISRFYESFNDIDLLLAGFFTINFFVWTLMYFLDVITIGRTTQDPLVGYWIRFIGTLIFSVGAGNGIPVYLIGKNLFGRDQGVSKFWQYTFILMYGMSIGSNLSHVSEHPVITFEPGLQFVFSSPDIATAGAVVSILVFIAPYIVFLSQVRSSRRFIRSLNKGSNSIDPYKSQQLFILEVSVYVYLLATVLSFSLLIVPYYIPQLILPHALNQLLSTPFILALVVMFYLAFRNPQEFRPNIFNWEKFTRHESTE